MAYQPIYTNETPAQVLGNCTKYIFVTPSGTDMNTGKLLPQFSGLTTAQILGQCVKLNIISPYGTTL